MIDMEYGSKEYSDALLRANKTQEFTGCGLVSQALLAANRHIEGLENNLMEEARLAGMGSEREAGLMAKVGELERKVARLEGEIEDRDAYDQGAST